MVLSIFLRGTACVLLKHLVKAVGIGVSDFFTDFGDVHFGGGEVNLCQLHTLLRQILSDGHTDVLFEDTADVDLVVIDVFQGALYARFDMRGGIEVAQKHLKPSWIGRIFLLVRMVEISKQMRQNTIDKIGLVRLYTRGHIFGEVEQVFKVTDLLGGDVQVDRIHLVVDVL